LTDFENSARAVLALADSAMKLNRPLLSASVMESNLADFMRPLLAEKSPWRTHIEGAQKRASDLALTATERRNERNGIRQALADSRDEKGARRHSQWLDHDVDEESNARWEARLHSLVTHELEKHQQLAAEKKREWEDRLKDQVLDKLNERLKDAEGTVRQLRQYLDREVYRVSQKRDLSMGPVWHLLDTGFERTPAQRQNGGIGAREG
jgi:hypothetical protein